MTSGFSLEGCAKHVCYTMHEKTTFRSSGSHTLLMQRASDRTIPT